MAVGLSSLPPLYPVPGVRLGTASAGIKYPGRRDLVVLQCVPESTVAGMFTRNRFCAAPVQLARRHMATKAPRVLLINAGNANAGTGEPGLQDAVICCQSLAQLMDLSTEEVLPFSTGVVGERLPVKHFIAALPQAVAALSETGWEGAAHGIMTTDTVAKGSSCRIVIDGEEITLTGIVKGAGMIRPDMATMLAFVATDAAIAPDVLQTMLAAAVAHSFNRITVDGDTSTNDACMLIATAQTSLPVLSSTESRSYAQLSEALTQLMTQLATAVIRDAEGATKFITIDVVNGMSEADCLEVAYTIAHSPLVKTAFFASDPNWGRILAAVGRARVEHLDVDAVSIHLGDVCVLDRGAVAQDYTEQKGKAVMQGDEITLRVDLAAGDASARVWTSDLSHEYIRINAEYRS